MKYLISMLFVSSICFAAPTSSKRTLPINKDLESMKKDKTAKNKAPKSTDKKAADCDEKAKKPVEITEESINLSGNTGCSVDEAKP